MEETHVLLDSPNDTPDGETDGIIVRAKTSLINTVMSTQAKVEETALRRQQTDRMPELLKLAEEVRKRLPPVLLELTAQTTPLPHDPG
jgi:hypothetical protein